MRRSKTAVVAVAGLAVAYALGWHGLTAEGLELAAFACVLAYVSLADLRRRIIPNRALGLALLVRVTYLACGGGGLGGIAQSLGAGLAVVAPILLVAFVLHRVRGSAGVGGGDVKLLFVVGCYLGWWRGLVVVALACLVGAVAAMARALVVREPARAEEGFPLGPYVALACCFVLVLEHLS